MKLRELIFKAKPDINDVRTNEDLYWLIEDLYSFNRSQIPMHYEDEIDDFVFFSKWERLLKEPIQYILGYGYFLGQKFLVNKNVLIPRNETEELVVRLIDIIKEKKYNSVLDIGLGSGAILFSIEKAFNKDKNYNFVGIDISKEALNIANINKIQLNINSKVVLSDVYENINEKFDVIVSNPPYISEDEFVEKRVLENEPHIALYAKNNGLFVYEKILKDAHKYINHNGLIAFEISPERQDGLIELINKYINYISYEFVKDMNGFIRFCYIFVK